VEKQRVLYKHDRTGPISRGGSISRDAVTQGNRPDHSNESGGVGNDLTSLGLLGGYIY
jgi:hypothetical protein